MNPLVVKAVVIDDELPVRRTLRSMLAGVQEVEVIGEAGNVTEGLDLILEKKPDLVFLDIKMPIRSGFDLLDELSSRRQFSAVIFISGYPDEALTAVQKAAPHRHCDFVLKPIDPQTLKQKFRLFYEKWKADREHESELTHQLETVFNQSADLSPMSGPRFLLFQNTVVFHRIEVTDIMYCESANKQINVYCSRQEHLNIPNVTLDVLERMLPPDRFVRIGKSHILNKEAISYLEKGARPKCRLVLGNAVRELLIYASNVWKVEDSYSGN
ncbi:LytR/AlgR family response regulator transcription factor [Larkinella soli]|uniref:LytR/AlgR family response regulator transcription factor n=1 Tax=Larkinella soli TaxID=1770527 RepID=UPI000FFB0F21|nr:LytTR family DNA-binding domain-containing protein [Larkinella soli]